MTAEGIQAIDPGLFTTVQDLGRVGFREWGVPVGGAFDGRSSAVANTLLGNDPEHAVLEMTLRGGVYLAERPLSIALAGAATNALILGTDGRERPFRSPGRCRIQAGEKLVVGSLQDGARAYLAVRGGWQASVRMGSLSAEDRIQPGERIPAASTTTEEIALFSSHLREWGWTAPSASPIRFIDGPDSGDLEAPTSLTHINPGAMNMQWWVDREWKVDSRSNRMGLRLDGPPVKIGANASVERLSTPVAPGAIQVAGGKLIVLGIACGTMGGYPHIAHVISADLPRLGQLRPSDLIRFERIEVAEARRVDAEARERDRAFLTRLAVALS